MKKLLVFSYHFPPSSEVAGKPTARLVRRLPEHGWRATVLVPPSWAYFERDPVAYADVTQYARVEPTGLWQHPLARRALARFQKFQADGGNDGPVTWSTIEERAAKDRGQLRRLASKVIGPVRRVVEDLTSVPDSQVGWVVPAYRHASRLLRRERFDAVLSVSPSVSAHLSALLLLRRHPDLTWFAQFHDPWTSNPYHHRYVPGLKGLDRRLESAVVGRCDRIVCATEEAAAQFAEAHGVGQRCLTLHNGFDPEDFPAPSEVRRTDHRLTFTYTGCLYGSRDPGPLFDSLGRLIGAGRLRADEVRVCLIGDCERVRGRSVRDMARDRGLESVVELIPPLPYPEAVARLMQSDVLLLFAEGQPLQIPAKLFEYLHVGRNILAFASGATARVVRESRAGQVVASDQAERIDSAILKFASERAIGPPGHDTTVGIDRYRADVLAASLARELEEAMAGRRPSHRGLRPVPV